MAPIVKKEKTKKSVYFPKTSNWFDFYNNKKYEGGNTYKVDVKEQYIPTFVRAGAFIPMAKAMQTTKEYQGNELILHYYFDPAVEKSKTELYNDDGSTVDAIEKGEYELMKFHSNHNDGTLEFLFHAETGVNYTASDKTIDFVIHNIKNAPESINMNGKKLPVNWNDRNKTVTIHVNWNTEKELKMKIRF